MANARLIRQNFFNDPLIAQKYNLKERYLLIGLACAADDFGRFWYNESNLKATIFPTDKNITLKWIGQCLDKLSNDFILCHYESDGIMYAHFPKWLDKGWFLKQRIDHPREYASPDCPICETEKKKRESSRAIKSNLIQQKENEHSITEGEINEILTQHVYSNKMLKKYPSITKQDYKKALGVYIRWVERNDSFDSDHEREFEGRLMGLQEELENEV